MVLSLYLHSFYHVNTSLSTPIVSCYYLLIYTHCLVLIAPYLQPLPGVISLSRPIFSYYFHCYYIQFLVLLCLYLHQFSRVISYLHQCALVIISVSRPIFWCYCLWIYTNFLVLLSLYLYDTSILYDSAAHMQKSNVSDQKAQIEQITVNTMQRISFFEINQAH